MHATLDDSLHEVVWMPAHCSLDSVGVRRTSNGELLTSLDIKGNELVDRLAKEAARADRLPRNVVKEVRRLGDRVTAVATWIEQITALANHFPDPGWDGTGTRQYYRDSEGAARRSSVKAKLRQSRRQQPLQRGETAACLPDRMTGHPRWEAIKRRVRAKDSAGQASSRVHPVDSNGLARLQLVHVPAAGDRGVRPHRKRKRLDTHWPAEQFQPCREVAAACSQQSKPERRTGAAETQTESLLELHNSGLKVAWPCCYSACAVQGRQEEPRHVKQMPARPEPSACSGTRPSSDEMAAAYELDELERCGLRVARRQ